MRFRLWALIGGALVSLAIAFLVLWPNGWAINRLVVRIYFSLGLERLGDLLPLEAPDRLDFGTLLNTMMLAPLAMLAVLALPRSRWWWVALGGAACAVLIETIQAVFLPGREGSVIDAVTNSIGALVGTLIGHGLNSLIGRRTSRSPQPQTVPMRQP